ncbi:replication initiator protein A [Gluconobacter cerinus]|uniref:replication initiator protein A n=2 Tax=Gluconobacter TaxID=441 RepID=UPI001B8D6E52|nr:replication initiator protein A [Gluconobacter cerinus]MBS1045603.1 replication initiator protein A [Gluconobacter cerinus]
MSIRKAPKAESQTDFFVPTLYDVGTKDSRSIMDVAVFRLSKRDRRAGEVIHYELSDGHVTVSGGAAGMASVWDYDLVLMAVSHLTEQMNRFREGKAERPSRIFRPHVADVLRFCRRSDGGKQKDDLVETCIRLNTTHVAVQRIKKNSNGKTITVDEGEPLISRYKIIKSDTGKPEYIEIELADWMHREITDGKNPEVLTVHPDYFLIDPGIGRFVYRLARRAAGKTEAKWSFQTIYDRSGSSGTLKKFTENLRKIINSNNLPEYSIEEELGNSGPLLVMTYRNSSVRMEDNASPQCTGNSNLHRRHKIEATFSIPNKAKTDACM